MDNGEAAAYLWDNLPFIVATVLVVLFGIACYMRRPIKAICLFASIVVSVIWGIV